MTTEVVQRGGLRWGKSHWSGMNATWPFATFRASADGVSISVRALGFMEDDLKIKKTDVIRIRRKRGIPFLNEGIIVEHRDPVAAPYILFWTMAYTALKSGLSEIGFTVEESR